MKRGLFVTVAASTGAARRVNPPIYIYIYIRIHIRIYIYIYIHTHTLVWSTAQSARLEIRSPTEAPRESARAAVLVAALSEAEPPAQIARTKSRGANGSFIT